MSRCLNYLALDFARKISEFPKWANEETADPETIHGYAWASEKALPIHTKSAAFRSAITVAMSDGLPEEVRDKAAGACVAFGITDDVSAVLDKLLDTTKSASEETPVYAIEDGEYQALPLSTASQIKHAAEVIIDSYRDEIINFPTLYKAARKINKRAKVVGCVVRQGVADLGTDSRLVDLDKAAGVYLRERAHKFEKHDNGPELAKQAADAFDEAVNDIEDGDELVIKLAAIDEELGYRPLLSRHKGRVTRPDVLIYNGVSKAAAMETLRENAIINEVFIPVKAVRAIPDEKMEYLLDKNAFIMWKEAADGFGVTEVVNSLTNDQRKKILQFATTYA